MFENGQDKSFEKNSHPICNILLVCIFNVNRETGVWKMSNSRVRGHELRDRFGNRGRIALGFEAVRLVA